MTHDPESNCTLPGGDIPPLTGRGGEVPDNITISEIMEQAQVFASAYALVGGRFDDGSKLRQSQDEKDNLEAMINMLVDQEILSERKRKAV